MDFYEPLPEFDANGIFLDFEDRRNGIDEWIEGEFTEWMCNRCLSVISDGDMKWCVCFSAYRMTSRSPMMRLL